MSILLQFLLTLLVAMFVVYTVVDLRATRSRKKSSALTPSDSAGQFPSVSLLLPVYNEKLVIKSLLRSVARLDYPADKLEILVLDDSTDETGALIRELVNELMSDGLTVKHLRREKHTGYKAGNLAYGLEHAQGDFVAIFDADCWPEPSFLRKVMPYFADGRIGFLQTGISYRNAGTSFLTRFQALEAFHKDEVTSGSVADGLMGSLTGTACVWRRSCIDGIGGVKSVTITEDVDMGYAAQLAHWRYMFLPENLASAELPESMASFRVQRQRWARGLVHNAARHARKLLQTPMRPLERLHAVALVFSPLLLALFYILLLLAPLIALSCPDPGLYFNLLCGVFLVAAIIWGLGNTSSANGNQLNSGFTRIADFIRYILLFFPLSLYYASAIVQLALGMQNPFHSTPKGYGRAKIVHPPVNSVLLYLEVFSLLYAAFAVFLGLYCKNYWVAFYGVLAGGGFAMSLLFSFMDRLHPWPAPRTILITGASGSIGQALAREYARPGVHMILQGRQKEKLDKLAEECAKLGASVDIAVLDLRDTDAVRAWSKSLGAANAPDLLIANAGLNTNTGSNNQGEAFEATRDLVLVNLLANFALVDGLLPAMRKRHSGQIAIVSSLAAYYGLPHTPTYCATKAALRNWGGAMRGWLQSEGIRINVILPGYVDSPMCRAMPGPKPFMWPAERAAKTIRRGLERDWARISFPFPLNLGIWALALLPACLAMPIAKILGYGR